MPSTHHQVVSHCMTIKFIILIPIRFNFLIISLNNNKISGLWGFSLAIRSTWYMYYIHIIPLGLKEPACHESLLTGILYKYFHKTINNILIINILYIFVHIHTHIHILYACIYRERHCNSGRKKTNIFLHILHFHNLYVGKVCEISETDKNKKIVASFYG